MGVSKDLLNPLAGFLMPGDISRLKEGSSKGTALLTEMSNQDEL